MNNAPTLSPADRLSVIVLMLIQAIVARAGIKLPASVLAMIEAQVRGIGEEFARLAASIEKGKPVPPRRERRTRRAASPRPSQARNSPLPQGGRARMARMRRPAAPLKLRQPRRTGLRMACGPPFPAFRKQQFSF